jgi:agmatinase
LLYPAGTPEPGGWTTRELKRIIHGLAGLNFVSVSYLSLQWRSSHDLIHRGADVVEVAPAYDHGKRVIVDVPALLCEFSSPQLKSQE